MPLKNIALENESAAKRTVIMLFFSHKNIIIVLFGGKNMFFVLDGKKLIKRVIFFVCGIFCFLTAVNVIKPDAAAVSADTSKTAYVAIVIDDFGYDGEGTDSMIALNIPFTAAVMPFSDKSYENVSKLQSAGKEMILHMPMESLTGKREWVGEKGIFKSMSDEEIKQRVQEALAVVTPAKGINNHMGSAIMEDERCFSAVMDVAAQKGLLFIDSMTTANTVAEAVCQKKGVPLLKRDVFLDSTEDINVVKKQLLTTAEIAKEKGYALAIGHVGPEGGNITAEAIKQMAPQLEQQGIVFVTVSQLAEILSK